MRNKGLGRREPKNFDHVSRAPYMAAPPFVVEKMLVLPTWIAQHDQGRQGACVGFGTSLMMSIINENQCRRQGDMTPNIRFNPWALWNAAKEIDEFPETAPGDDNGTTVKAASQILINKGHVLWTDDDSPAWSGVKPWKLEYGIASAAWATTVDQIRAAIGNELAVSLAITWYDAFDTPEMVGGEYWIGRSDFGRIAGGHCICCTGASDARGAFALTNSWGASYPQRVWISYDNVGKLIENNGEALLSTDR